MELNLKKIQQMDSKEIYNYMLPIINSIYQSLEYIGISGAIYYKLMLKKTQI